MAASDLDVVHAIEVSSFASPWSREALEIELGNPRAFYVVAESNGVVTGYGGEWIILDEAHITNIAVLPAGRGKRFGERLLIALLQEARYRGARRATLEVRVGNAVAIALYRKYGFESVAIRKRYYADNDEDALVMWVNDLYQPSLSGLLNQPMGGGEDD
jgi:ribosomal-protein-alanine N-acetyltransferase